jgi:predicted Rossmann-fold nucleotide-binding protein
VTKTPFRHSIPAGSGALDETFETLTLLQTGKASGVGVILVGRPLLEHLVDWQLLADQGFIDEDLRLFQYAGTAREAWELIVQLHGVPSAL